MSSPADQISALLPSNIIDGTNWIRVVGKMVDTPNKVAVFYDTGGLNPNPRFLLDYRSVMCQVRGDPNTYGDTYQKCQDIRDFLLGLYETLASGDRVDGITVQGDIAFLNYDSNLRPTFSVNFKVFWEPAANSISTREPL